MSGTESRTELPLVSSASGCSCCSTETSTASLAVTGTAVEFGVEGLTCGHCVQTVEKAVSALDGVDSASVQLVPGGRSRLLVNGTANSATVNAAVTAAGYTMTGN